MVKRARENKEDEVASLPLHQIIPALCNRPGDAMPSQILSHDETDDYTIPRLGCEIGRGHKVRSRGLWRLGS